MESGELLAERMVLGGRLEGGNLRLEGSGPGFDVERLEQRGGKHHHQQRDGRNPVPPPDGEQSQQGNGAAGNPPAEVAGKEVADDPAGNVAGLGAEDGRGEDEGEDGDAANSEGDGQPTDSGQDIHGRTPA